LASGSVWPAVLLHSAWNAVIQGTFDSFTKGGDASHNGNIWTGESGVLVVAAEVLVAGALTMRAFEFHRTPADESSRLLSLRDA